MRKFSGDANAAATIGLSVFLLFNLLTIHFLVETILDFSIVPESRRLSRSTVFLISLPWFLANYAYFTYRGRYKKILKDFDAEAKLNSKRYYFPGAIYMGLSTFLLIFMSVLKVYLHNRSI
jgi:hypothetical protein